MGKSKSFNETKYEYTLIPESAGTRLRRAAGFAGFGVAALTLVAFGYAELSSPKTLSDLGKYFRERHTSSPNMVTHSPAHSIDLAANDGTVQVKTANVRECAASTCEIVAHLPLNTSVNIIATNAGWNKISAFKGDKTVEGYVYSKSLKIGSTQITDSNSKLSSEKPKKPTPPTHSPISWNNSSAITSQPMRSAINWTMKQALSSSNFG